MRSALWILGLFALAVAFTLAARVDQGYVIIVFPPWRMELSFMLALLLLAGLLAFAYTAFRLAGIALNLSSDMRAWNAKRRQENADKALVNAMRAYLDGDLKQTAKFAGKAGASTLAPDLVERLKRPAQAASAVVAGKTTESV